MRKYLTAAVAVLTLGALGTQAEARTWECQGPAASCEKSATAIKRVYTAKSVKHGKHQASHKTHSSKRVASSGKVRSSGGGSLSGMGSYYWQPQALASGGRFNPNAMTAAHKTLPFGTKVRVTNRNNGRSVVVTINDRGPYIKGRIIDLSKAAAGRVGMTATGVAPVSVSIIGRG